MALINFFDTPLSSPKQKNITKEGNLAKLIDDYLVDKEALEEVEVYNAKTGKSYKKKIVPDSYKVCAVVNGNETELSYVPKSSDVIDIIISPRSKSNGYDWLQFVGSALMVVVGAVLTFASGGTLAAPFSQFGIPLMIGGVMGMCGAAISMLTRQDEDASKHNSDDIDKEAALTIKGAENELITGQRFPFVFGKIAVNPRIYGSPYHETFVKPDGKFDSQYMNCLYCVGYGPLKLTDFKVGETVLMYNHPRDVEGEKENNTIIHGHIRPFELATIFEQTVANRNEYYTYNADKNSYDRADPQPTETTFPSNNWYKLTDVIPKKWKNNDVAIEILQRGLKNETDIATNEKWGTLYNKTVIEDQVDANILFIHDNDISVAAEKNYKGVAIPKGFRTNTVRLSQSCPSHLEVEVDFSNGLYRNRTEKHGDYSSMRYYDIPVRLAVQWRAVKKNNPVSDAENGTNGGWKTFDYLKLGDSVSTWQRPYPYSIKDSIYDMSLNAGASTENLEMFRAGQAAYARDHLYRGYYDEALVTTTADAQYARPYSPTGVPARNYYTETEKAALASSNAAGIASQKTNEWVDVNDFIKNSQAIEGGYITSGGYNDQWVGTQVFCINADKNFSTSHKPKDFNGNERLYVFTKDFTAAEVQEILASGSDWVEVRVIRLTPCYLDQSGVQSDNYGDFSYQDLCKWTYLRTTCFDKDAYTSAASTDSSADPKDYPLRPIRESDLSKFCFMAIRLKQDVAETGGSSLKKIRLTAESFSPKYNEEEKKWYPENLEASWGFYQKQKIDGEWKIVELTEQEYRDKVLAREPNLFKKKKGNNYTQLVANDIFVNAGLSPSTFLNDFCVCFEVTDTYKPFVIKVLQQMSLIQSSYKPFSEGISDIDENYATELNITDLRRRVSAAQMLEKGWVIGEGNYATYLSHTLTYNSSGNPADDNYSFALVVTPILDDGTILTYEEMVQNANKIAKGQTPTDDVLFARFNGNRCVENAEIYAMALHYLGDLYYEPSKYTEEDVLESFEGLKNYTYEEFIETSYSGSVSPITNFYLSAEVEKRYVDTNTACSTMLAFVGPQNGEEAKGYDDINMTSATELFEFCKDVTDGTPLDFNYVIDSNFNTACNLTAQARVKTKAEMEAAGWDIGEGDYATYYSVTYTYDASGEPEDEEYTFALVVTPILDDGTVLTEADLIICANKIAKGETPPQNVLLARFDGPDCVQTSDLYCEALHDLGDLYFDQSAYAQTDVLEQFLALKDIPFNRFIEDSPEEFLDAFETYFELPAGSYYYTTKVLEQMMLTQSTYKPFADNDDLRHIKFSCNGVISEEKKLEEIVKTFLTTARSMLRRDDENRYEFFIGKKVDYPVDVLNAKNVISKSNTRSFAEVPSGLQTNFPDEEDDYTQNPLYIMDKGEDWRNPSKPMEQFSIQFVTNRYQIRSLGLYNLAGRLFQRETYNRTVGRRGLAYTLGDVLLLQDESILVGTDNGGHIMELIKYNNVIYGFVSDEPFEYTGELVNGQSKQGVTVVQPDKYGAARCVTLRVATPQGNAYITPENWKVGLTNIIALAHPIICTEDGNYSDEPVTEDGETCALTLKEGDLLAFGEMTNITRKAQIVQIKPSQGKFNLTLVPYNDDFYNYGKELPRFNATLSVPQRDVQEVEFTEYATKADIAESKAVADGNKKDPNIDLTAYTTITTCRATRDGIVLTCDTRNIADGEKLTPISVTWTFVRENVWTRDPSITDPNIQYILASPQPTMENFDEDEYYVLNEGQYVRAEEYAFGATYYVKNVMIEDVIINQITSNEETLSYLFDRGLSVEQLGGYPEYYDFYPIKVMASAKLTVSSKTADSLYSRIDITNYGTWVPRTPVIEQTVQDRHIVLTFSQPDGARVLYGQDSMIYRVQIKKVADNFSEDYAKPDLQSNPYAEFNQQQELIFSNESNYKYFYLANPQPTSTEQILAGEYYKKGSYDYEKVSVYEGGVDYYLLDHGYIQSGRTFAQTLPLKGQGTKEMENTDYMYEVRAEAVNGMVTEPSHSMVTAMFTNFRDIVYAKAEQKELYVPNLSAISAELGEISGGSMAGNKNNYWTLTTKDNPQPDLIGEDNGNRDFQGAIRFGSDSQYIRGRPIVSFINGRYEIVDFELEFKIGSFDISSERTVMDSEIIIYNEDISEFDRCRISVFGTYYENRTNAGVNDKDSDVPGGWKAVAYQESGGLMSKSVYSEDSLLLTNATIDERRTMGYDVGKPYLYLNDTTVTKVWHFDTNSYDQNGSYTLEYTTTRDNVPCINAYDKNGNLVYVLEYTSNRTRPRIIGRDSVPLELEGTRWTPDRNNAVMDFKPAILAVAPFSNIARSLFGVYKLTFDLDNDAALGAKVSTTGKFTVDFWIKFYYAEGQTLFDIGTANDRIQFVCTKGEVNYNAPQTYVLPTSQPESQQDIDEGEFYERHGTDFTRAYTYNSGTTYYIYAPEPPYNYDIKYSEGFVLADPQPTSQSDFGKGIPYFVVSGNDYVLSNTYVSGVDYYVQIVPYNHATSGTDDDMYIRHQGVSNFEVVTMRTLKRPDEIENNQRLIGEGMWTHFAVVLDEHKICCYINDRKIEFARYSNSNLGATAIINDNTEQIIVGTAVQSEDHTVILDELMIDTQVAEEFASFVVADPQPASQATIDAGVYYYLDNGVYVEARTYVAGTTYYVVDTYSGFNFVKSTANKIPWGNLNSENDYLVLVAKEDANGKPLLKTNIFNSDEFRAAVQAIIDSQE